MTNRLHMDKNTREKFGNFVGLLASEPDVREVHASIASDLDLRDIADQYQDLKDSDVAKGTQTPMSIPRKIYEKDQHDKCYIDVIKVLAQILASKPHSADCERLVFAQNTIKTNSRSHLQRQTISQYLYININMPVVASFDTRPVVHLFLTEQG